VALVALEGSIQVKTPSCKKCGNECVHCLIAAINADDRGHLKHYPVKPPTVKKQHKRRARS